MNELPTKITHDSFVELSRLKAITVTDKRFKELTNNAPIDALDEVRARAVIDHLRKIQPYSALYSNVIMERLETNQQKNLIDPRELAGDIVPHLMDCRSREFWNVPA